MGERAGLPNINEVTFFLHEHAPGLLDDLESKGGEFSRIAQLGIFGGDEKVDEDKLRNGLQARAEVVGEALNVAIEKAEDALHTIRQKLALVRRTRFTASVLSSASASGVIAAASLSDYLTSFIGALLALGSNIVSMFSDTLILGERGREAELAEISKSLSKAIGQSTLTGRMLPAMLRTDFSLDEMRALLQEANQLFSDITVALSRMP